MADNKKLTTEDPSLDDELNMPEFSFDAGDVPDNRSPAQRIKEAATTGVKSTLTNPATYGKLMRNALPKEYGDAYDEATDIRDMGATMYRDAVKEIKPVAGQLASAVDGLIPDRFKGVKKALQKTKEWSQSDWRDSGGDADKQKEAALQLQLDQVFNQQQSRDAKEEAQQKVTQGVDIIRHRDNITLLQSIANSIHRVDQYQSKVNQAFQRKTLELQYRSYGVASETLNQLKLMGENQRVRLDAITKNTGLPDFVKMKSSEALKEQLRNNFINSMHNRAGSFVSNNQFTKQLLSNIQRTVGDVVSDVANAGSAAAMPLEFANLGSDLGMERKKNLSELIIQLATSGMTGNMLNRYGDKARNFMENDPRAGKVQKGASFLNKWSNDGHRQGAVKDFMNSSDEDTGEVTQGGLLGWLQKLMMGGRNMARAGLRDVMPSTSIQTGLQTDSLGQARAPAVYSNQAQKSLTEIIPGYLARILREVTMIRTGDHTAGLIEYDYKKNSFRDVGAKYRDIKDDIVQNSAKDQLARTTMGGLGQIDDQGELSEDERKVLGEFLVRRRATYGGTVDNEHITNPAFYEGAAAKHADKYANFFRNKFEVGADGKMGSPEAAKRQAEMSNWYQGLGTQFRDVQKKAQEYVNAGDYEGLRQSGLMNATGDGLDETKLLDAMVEGINGQREGSSDVDLKTNINKLSPMRALNSIKNIGVSMWNYKSNGKSDDGGKTHVGPMAQDVQRVVGDQFAPNGKKIDLVNMNGLNMSGLLDVDKKVDAQSALVSQSLNQVIRSQQMVSANMEKFNPEVTDGSDGDVGKKMRKSGKFSKETKQDQMIRHLERISKNTEEALIMGMLVAHADGKGGNNRIDDLFKRYNRADLSLPQNASVARRLQAIGVNVLSLTDQAHDYVEGKANKYGNMAWNYAKDRGGWLKDKAQGVWDRATGGRSMKDIATEGRVALSNAKDELFAKYDMFVEGEVEPRLQAVKLQAGMYKSKMTGKVIQTIKDIDSDIIDENGNVVMTVAQLQKSYYKTGVQGKVVKAGKWFTDLAAKTTRWLQDTADNMAGGGLRALKRAWEFVKDAADQPRDIYVRGELRPRLLGIVMVNGGYYSKNTKKVIMRPSQIDGPVTNYEGQVLITDEDMTKKGLVDLDGRPIESGFARTVGTAVRAASGVFAFGKGLLTKGKDFLINAKNDGMANMGKFFDKILGAGSGAFGGKEGITLLTQIRDILDQRLGGKDGSAGKPVFGDTDGDGIRDNSAAAKAKARKESGDDGNKNNDGVQDRKNANSPTAYQTRNTFDIIGDAIGGLKDKAMGFLGSAAEAAGGFAGGAAGNPNSGPQQPKKRGRFGRMMDAAKGKFGGTRAGAAIGGAAAASGAKMAAAKGVAGAFLKKLPGIGLGVGAIDAIRRIMSDDMIGAAMTLGAGATAMLPGPGTAASVGLDAALMARDSGMMGGHVPGTPMGGGMPGQATLPPAAPAPTSGANTALSTAADVAGTVAGSAATAGAGGAAAGTVAKGGRFAGATSKWGGLKYIGKAAALPFKGAMGAAKLGAKGVGALASGAGWAAGKLGGAAKAAGSAAQGPIARYGGAAARGVGGAIRAVGTPLANVAGAGARIGAQGVGLAARGAMSGTGMLARGAWAVGKFGLQRLAVPLLMNVALPLLGAIFSPAGVAIAGAALLGYGAYKLYKYATRKEFKDIERLRFIQYGLHNGDDEYMRKIYELEQLFEPMVQVSDDGTATLAEKKFDVKKMLDIFGINENDGEKVGSASEWLEQRFKPVFLTHAGAMKKMFGDAKLEKMETLSKNDKLKLLPLVTMPGGPWHVTASPFPDVKKLNGDGSLIEEAVSWVRKQIDKLKDDPKNDKAKDVSKITASVGATSALPGSGTDARDKPKEAEKKSFFDSVAEKFTSLTGFNLSNKEEGTTKVAMTKVSVESQEVSTLRADALNALNAIRYKSYGLKKTTYNEVLSLNYLEEAVLKEMRTMGNKKVMWVGDIASVAKKAARFFEFNSTDEQRMTRWTQWFMGRFLPIYTSYLAEIYNKTGKAEKLSAELSLTPIHNLELGNMLVAMSQCWRVTDMPWREGEVNTDPSSCDENIQFLRGKVKEFELAQEKAAKESVTGDKAKFTPPVETAGETTAPTDPKTGLSTDPDVRRNQLLQNTPNGYGNTSASSAEMPATAVAQTPEQLKAQRDARLSGLPIAAGGQMSNGSDASKWMDLRNYRGSKANVEGLNPAMKKNLFSMIQEYGEKTGRRVGINRGMVTNEQQAAEYKENPGKAAKPGSSLHEFGLAVDIDRVTLNEMDSMGLLKKYGFTRPVGGEPWHLEPAGIQGDRQAVKKDPKMATDLINGGVGKGGGGFGTVDGAAQGQINPEMAKRIQGGDTLGKQPTSIDAKSPASDAKVVESGGAQGMPSIPANKRSTDAVGAMGTTASNTGVKGTISDVATPAAGAKGYQAMKATIDDAAKLTGVDPNKLASLMAIESSFNPNARNTDGSGADGLGQFKPKTWKAMVARYGKQYGIDENTSPSDPKANAIMTGLLYKENQGMMEKYKPNPSEADMYSTHLMGAGVAKQFHGMKDSDFPANTLTKEAAGNPGLYYKDKAMTQPRTKAEMLKLFGDKLAKARTTYGIGEPAQEMAVANNRPAANQPLEGGIMRTSFSGVEPVVQRPPETPVTASRQEPVIATQPRMTNDIPQGDIDRIALSKSMSSVEDILRNSYDIQVKMLDALGKMVEGISLVGANKGAKESTPDIAKPAVQKANPATPSFTPDRSARQVAEPAVPMRHRTQV